MAWNADVFWTVVESALPTLDQRVYPGPRWGSALRTTRVPRSCLYRVSEEGEGVRNNLSSWASIATFALFLLPATLAASAQTAPPDRPSTDAEKIADALRAGPRFITKDATLLDWPTTPDGEYRVLRQGTNEWTCLAGVPGYPHDEPGCFDPTFMQWMKDSLAGRLPHIDRVGLSYMYAGAWVPNKSAEDHGSTTSEFHVGPHIMIISPHRNQQELRVLSHDGSNGMPYVTQLPNGTDLFLVIPVRQWDEN
jgi:hypothetical protein